MARSVNVKHNLRSRYLTFETAQECILSSKLPHEKYIIWDEDEEFLGVGQAQEAKATTMLRYLLFLTLLFDGLVLHCFDSWRVCPFFRGLMFIPSSIAYCEL